jgi:F-type H+-transporting ATPase subunit b
MSELIANFGIDWKLLIAQIVNFAVLLYLLRRYAYTPLLEMLEKRRGIVIKGLEDASEAEKRLSKSIEDSREIESQAKREAQAVLVDAKNQAENLIDVAKADAMTEKDRIVLRAKKEIEILERGSENHLKESAAKYIIEGIKGILKDEVDEKMNARIVEKIVKSAQYK